MKLPQFLTNFQFHWSKKPQAGMKVYTMEGAHPDEPVKTLYESQLHPSVFQENLPAEHPEPHFDKAIFSWIAPEYLQHPKSINWWVWAGVVLFVSMILEAITGNWTMLAATLTFGVVYWYLHEHHPPRHTKINISELGIKIGHQTIHYNQIEAFWIVINPPITKRLYFRLSDKLLPDLVIELEHEDSQAIRKFLEMHLTEITGVQDRLSDLVLRIFKI